MEKWVFGPRPGAGCAPAIGPKIFPEKFMSKAWLAMLAGVSLLLAQGIAKADTLSVTADIPLQLQLKLDKTDVGNSVSGYKVGVSLPFLVGFGVEGYKAALDKKDFGAKGDLNLQLVDIFLNLPVPVVNIALGAGVGTASFDPNKYDLGGGDSLKLSSGTVTQYFASVGIPIAVLFDVHLGYHVLSGKFDTKTTTAGVTTKDSSDLKATLITLGAKAGF